MTTNLLIEDEPVNLVVNPDINIDISNLVPLTDSNRECTTLGSDYAIETTQSSICTSRINKESLNFVVCQKPRDLSKYRRHLMLHVKNHELLEDSVDNVLFEFRTTRNDTKPRNLQKPRIGYMLLHIHF